MITATSNPPDGPPAALHQTLLLIARASSALREEGMLPATAGDPALSIVETDSLPEALAILLTQDIALVIVDADAVGADLGAACRILRRERAEPLVPILCIGARDPRTLPRSGNDGRTAQIEFLLAPVAAPTLRNRLTTLLETDAARRRTQLATVRLASERAYYESIIDAVGEGVLGLSSSGVITFANPAAVALLESGGAELVGQRFHGFYPLQGENDTVWQYTPFFHCWLTGTVQQVDESFFRRAGGSRFPVSFRCAPLASQSGGVVIAFRDITARHQLEARLRAQAVIDPLTGLCNRDGFKLALTEAVNRAQVTDKTVALLSIDLDRFNRINNTLGHDTGDFVLQAAARRLQECVGEYDLVARVASDQFAIVLADLEQGGRETEVVDTILASLRRPFGMPDGLDVTVSASIGVASFPAAAGEVDVLMRCAEVAMKQSKNDGRGQAQVYAPEMNMRAAGRLAFEQALRVAVDERSFTLDYQPQIDLANGNVVGFEALLRWQHDDIGNVSPSQFVPMLEETGLIVPVGRWVFESGCRQRQLWAQTLPDQCTISINLSPRQFTDKRLASQIRHILEVNELPAYQLEIELTESLLMLDREYTHGVLHALKDMGLKLSVDDFGTGYSSLAYLKLFALDALKIDKQFIDQLTASKRDAAIATSIIQLAHNLGLEVVAEGVETLAQVQLLRELGCDVVQGYYFGKPLSVTEVGAFPHRMQMQ